MLLSGLVLAVASQACGPGLVPPPPVCMTQAELTEPDPALAPPSRSVLRDVWAIG